MDNNAILRTNKVGNCKHLSSIEIGMIEDDKHGCKVYECEKCKFRFDWHNPYYGCRIGQ